MSELWRRLLCLFRCDRPDRDLEEEMRFHLDTKAAEHGTHAAAVRQPLAEVLAVAGLLACHIPARRATRIDPVAALRFE